MGAAGKQANGAGSVKYRDDKGLWEARFTYADPVTGATKRATCYGKTQREARAKMRERRARVEAGKPVRDSRETVGAYVERWITTTLEVSDRKPTTKATYATLARKHLIGGEVGAITLDKMRPTDVEALILALREVGLSSSTIRQTYTVLRMALDAAERDGLVARNVAALVKRPGVERVEARSLSPEHVRAVLDAAKGSRYEPLLSLLASTGMRRGEALALRWDDVDLDAAVLRVRATVSSIGGRLVTTEPKSERSRRSLNLAASTVAMLRRHRATQAEARLRAGALWHDLGLVFTTDEGKHLDPNNAARAMRKAAHAAGIDGVGLHTLRHSAASAMLAAGMPITDVSRMLGHSSVAITGDIYGHTSTDGQRRAAEVLAAALGM
ncbi:tyrosine-type recombinase/integrase [Agromyces kandeliae]|uniref:Tyrosine-type recombinase/integrase n=1 Tax=Agromyces kandeliae TaxID=2666141 RepID=A0A6L5QYE7_9MICO|nr:site-specific integrase [Agromyces kandeliae]MRX42354.1 tyrosine-type recombinase/integrase [Agromyces kandeliae]